MHDVHASAELLGQPHHERDSFRLGALGTRCEVRGVAPRVAMWNWRDVLRQLGVDEERRAERCENGHGFAQIGCRDTWKFVDAARNEEALEEPDAACE